MDKRQWS